jgi:hypothetical protein
MYSSLKVNTVVVVFVVVVCFASCRNAVARFCRARETSQNETGREDGRNERPKDPVITFVYLIILIESELNTAGVSNPYSLGLSTWDILWPVKS